MQPAPEEPPSASQSPSAPYTLSDTTRRDLDWPGCVNVRDLGGLPTNDGAVTCWARVVRSDNPAYLTDAGWSALHDHGVRAIIALRTSGADDDEPDPRRVPGDVVVQRVVIEDVTEPEFRRRCVDNGLFATPAYFPEMLDRWQDRCAAAVAAVAMAGPGAVVVSCGRGCDRTGLLAFLLLSLAGVPAAHIAADWLASVDRLRQRDPTYETALQQILDRHATTVEGSIRAALQMDVPARLRAGGLDDADIRAVRGRLLT